MSFIRIILTEEHIHSGIFEKSSAAKFLVERKLCRVYAQINFQPAAADNEMCPLLPPNGKFSNLVILFLFEKGLNFSTFCPFWNASFLESASGE